MKEIGLIFSAEMALANVRHRKTMTRRLRGLEKINEDPNLWRHPFYDSVTGYWNFWQVNTGDVLSVKCPFGGVGDKIWQREAFRPAWAMVKGVMSGPGIQYKADGVTHGRVEALKQYPECQFGECKWRSPLFLFRWASRFEALITSAPVPMRLQAITEADAIREGFNSRPGLTLGGAYGLGTAIYWFKKYWDSKNAAKGLGYDFNPWVWPIGYENDDSGR